MDDPQTQRGLPAGAEAGHAVGSDQLRSTSRRDTSSRADPNATAAEENTTSAALLAPVKGSRPPDGTVTVDGETSRATVVDGAVTPVGDTAGPSVVVGLDGVGLVVVGAAVEVGATVLVGMLVVGATVVVGMLVVGSHASSA